MPNAKRCSNAAPTVARLFAVLTIALAVLTSAGGPARALPAGTILQVQLPVAPGATCIDADIVVHDADTATVAGGFVVLTRTLAAPLPPLAYYSFNLILASAPSTCAVTTPVILTVNAIPVTPFSVSVSPGGKTAMVTGQAPAATTTTTTTSTSTTSTTTTTTSTTVPPTTSTTTTTSTSTTLPTSTTVASTTTDPGPTTTSQPGPGPTPPPSTTTTTDPGPTTTTEPGSTTTTTDPGSITTTTEGGPPTTPGPATTAPSGVLGGAENAGDGLGGDGQLAATGGSLHAPAVVGLLACALGISLLLQVRRSAR